MSLSTNDNFVAGTYYVENTTITFKGFIYAETTGTYTFSISSDDGSYFWIDKYPETNTNYLINNGGGHGVITKTDSYNLTAGMYYSIFILYGNMGGGSNFYFSFTDPSNTVYSGNTSGWLFN